MKKNILPIVIKIGLAALAGISLYLFVGFINEEQERSEKEWADKMAPKQMPIPWCVNVCQEDIFSDMHSSGDSWGTSSSSMGGMTQSDTFSVVIKHCNKIYAEGCIKIESYYGDHLHMGNRGKKAMAGKI